MPITQRPNKDALSKALDIYLDAMRPMLHRNLRQIKGKNAKTAIIEALHRRNGDASDFEMNLERNDNNIEASIDHAHISWIITTHWSSKFRNYFRNDNIIRSATQTIGNLRNEVAHIDTNDLDRNKALQGLSSIISVLNHVNEPEAVAAVEEIQNNLMNPPKPETPAVTTADTDTTQQTSQTVATNTQTQENATTTPEPDQDYSNTPLKISKYGGEPLKPWREVISPHPDVQSGEFQEAEFAADLQAVFTNTAKSREYAEPELFFERTFITPGLRTLILNVLQRINNKGGNPVIQMQTGFGGGKTHSLISILHLIRDHQQILASKSSSADELRDIFNQADINTQNPTNAKIAVLHGTYISTTSSRTTDSGHPLNTIWAEMAYQLGGENAYQFVHKANISGTAPVGEELDNLFNHVGPSVILIDELVKYVANAPADMHGNIYAFLQALTESATRAGNVVVVVTLPEHAVEAGGDKGMAALATLARLFSRIQSIWKPLQAEEAFKVVSRRLFQHVTNTEERDRTCKAFFDMYNRNRTSYPAAASEANYLQKLKECYPIHPELLDRLYYDWSTIPTFQQTRAMLRMIAQCINSLCVDNNTSPLIMPADLPLDDTKLASEFGNILDGRWDPIFDEIDGPNSKTREIDRRKSDYVGVGGATQRAARTIFLGSATGGNIRGIDNRHINLGAAMPSHGTAIYTEVVTNMRPKLYYLYTDADRFYFHSEPNLNKLVQDKISLINDAETDAEIEERIKHAVRRRIPANIIVFPDDTYKVPDDNSRIKIVVLAPHQYIPNRKTDTDYATPAMQEMLEKHGDSKRSHRNMILFIAAKSDDIRVLRNEIKYFLAWKSITEGPNAIPNLGQSRRNQANKQAADYDFKSNDALIRAYIHTIAPTQLDPQKPEQIDFSYSKIDKPAGDIAKEAYDQFIQDETIVEHITPGVLATQLKQQIWNSEQHKDHIHINTLWNIFASQIYMERLRDPGVLHTAIAEGTPKGLFGHADSLHDGEYQNLKFNQRIDTYISENIAGILVHPEMANLQKEEEAKQQQTTEDSYAYTPTIIHTPAGTRTKEDDDHAPPPKQTTKIVASKIIQGELSIDEVSKAKEEIIRNLIQDGANVTIRITIEAEKPAGITQLIEQSIRQNSQELGFHLDTSN